MIDSRTMTRAKRFLFRRKTIDPSTGKVRQQERAGRELLNTHRQRVVITEDASIPTGCWRLDGKTHRIKLSPNFDDCLDPATKANPKQVEAAAKSLGTHECCHGLYTHTDGAHCAAEMARLGLPFRLFNLAEDIRIEHLYRATHAGFKFGWERHFGNDASYTKPVQYLLGLAHREASRFSTMSAAAAPLKWDGAPTITGSGTGFDGKQTHLVIQEFYSRMTKAPYAPQLIPIVEEWCRVFGIDKPDHVRLMDEINGEFDGKHGDPANDPSGKGSGGDGTERPPARDKLCATEILEPNEGKGLSADAERELRRFMSSARLNWDERQARAIERSMQEVRDNAAHVAAEIATRGPAVHVAGAMLNDSRSFRTYTTDTGNRTITVIVDFSGSMEGTWATQGGQEFIVALVRMHRAGEIDARIWLTEERGCVQVPAGEITNNELRRLNDFGWAEGLRATLEDARVIKDMEDSSLTVIWTDGMITDGDCGDLVKRYRSQGIDIVGAAPRPDDAEHGSKTRRNIKTHIGTGWVGDGIALARRIAEHVINRGR